ERGSWQKDVKPVAHCVQSRWTLRLMTSNAAAEHDVSRICVYPRSSAANSVFRLRTSEFSIGFRIFILTATLWRGTIKTRYAKQGKEAARHMNHNQGWLFGSRAALPL